MLLIFVMMLLSCAGKEQETNGTSITSDELLAYFKKHKIDGYNAVALKKKSLDDMYLVTVHGYPDNKSVCEDIIKPYNENPDLSDISGEYYCEVLEHDMAD